MAVVGSLQAAEVDEVGIDPRELRQLARCRVAEERSLLEHGGRIEVREPIAQLQEVTVVNEPQRAGIAGVPAPGGLGRAAQVRNLVQLAEERLTAVERGQLVVEAAGRAARDCVEPVRPGSARHRAKNQRSHTQNCSAK